jgi:formylglycine-generating enzyme required for sulfatase activity
MGLEADLVFVANALRLGFVTEAQAQGALTKPGGARAALVSTGALSETEAVAVDAVTAAALARKDAARPPSPPARPASAPGAPVADGTRGGHAESGVLGTVALGRPREGGEEDLQAQRLSASGVARIDDSREGTLVLALGSASADVFSHLMKKADLHSRPEDRDLAAVPASWPPSRAAGRKIFVMRKAAHGKPLADALDEVGVLGELHEAAQEARLLRVLRDACLAVAFAHDQGIAHRQLSPAAILIGSRGETILAEWDSAKIVRASTGRTPSRVRTGEMAAPGEAGDPVFLIPAYSAPEVLGSGLQTADLRSDVYSLGAILYRLLARRPPYDGAQAAQVLARQKAGPPLPPSKIGRIVARDLEATCLKALSTRRDQRFESALTLVEDLEAALGGGLARKRELEAVSGQVERARKAVDAYREALDDARHQAMTARREATRCGSASPEATAARDAAAAAEKAMVGHLREAEQELKGALELAKDHPEARRLKAELHWSEYLHAEDLGDEKAALLHRQAVATWNDGTFDVRLRGDGTLSVQTSAYGCGCLRSGRPVPAQGAIRLDYCVASGRAVSGGAEGLRRFEWTRPISLKAHGPGCALKAEPGAEVWLYRMETEGALLMPVAAEGAAVRPAPPKVLDALYVPDSPFRPRGPGLHLGKTPIQKLSLPAGSYLLILAKDGRRPVRAAVRVPACEAVIAKVTLYGADEIPDDFVQVPEGKFSWQGDRGNVHSQPHEVISLPEFFISRYPVTCARYAEFLNDIGKTDAKAAMRAAPREVPAGPPLWQGPPWKVPAGPSGRRLPGCAADWSEHWPVLGVSWEDAMSYAAWLRGRLSYVFSLPHELEWEKAARAADRRRFPWGNAFGSASANAQGSFRDGARPADVERFPVDESPCGARGMGGNSRDFCLNGPGADYPAARVMRGGSWASPPEQGCATFRATAAAQHVSPKGGFRLVLLPSLEA